MFGCAGLERIPDFGAPGTKTESMPQHVEADLARIGWQAAEDVPGAVGQVEAAGGRGLDPLARLLLCLPDRCRLGKSAIRLPVIAHFPSACAVRFGLAVSPACRLSGFRAGAAGTSADGLAPIDLLAAARLFTGGEAAAEVHFRRAISTACYSLFHHVLYCVRAPIAFQEMATPAARLTRFCIEDFPGAV